MELEYCSIGISLIIYKSYFKKWIRFDYERNVVPMIMTNQKSGILLPMVVYLPYNNVQERIITVGYEANLKTYLVATELLYAISFVLFYLFLFKLLLVLFLKF